MSLEIKRECATGGKAVRKCEVDWEGGEKVEGKVVNVDISKQMKGMATILKPAP